MIPTVRRSLSAAALVATLLFGFAAGTISADQPRMDAALVALREAKAQLTFASPDKGGHRAKAIRHIDNAIREVERGIRYDRRN